MARPRKLERPRQPLNIPRAYARLASEEARYKVCFGGRGSGKSWTIARLLIARAFSSRRRILCAREFQASIADSVHKLLAEQIVDLGLSRFFDVQASRIVCLTTGSEFLFKGLRRSIQAIRSLEGIDECWVEEAQAVSEESWNILIPTIRKPASSFWVSFNPFEEQDPTFQRFVLHPPPGAIVLKTSWRDNPRLPDVLDAERKYMLRVDPGAYDWVWEGNTRHISDAVIFKGKFRIDTFEPPEGVRFRFGADWGFAVDPTVLTRSYIVGKRLFIDWEAYGIGVELNRIPILFDQVPGSRQWPIMADDSRPETINHVRGLGFSVKGAKKWKGSVEDGIEHLRAYEEIVIHERCQHMAQEARLYSYKTDEKSQMVLPQIRDAHNHCIAAGELITTGRGTVPVEEVEVGDLVQTRAGMRRVYRAWLTSSDREVWELRAGGMTLRATRDHEVFVCGRGMVRMDALSYRDEVLVLSCGLRRSVTEGVSGGAIQTPMVSLTAAIFDTAMHIVNHLSTFIASCGRLTSAQFHLVAIFITGTAIPQTMTPRTSNVLPRSSMCSGTQTRPSARFSAGNIWTASARWLRRGMERQKEWRSTAASVLWLMRGSFPRQSCAGIAEASLRPASSGTRTSTAPMHVERLQGGPLEPIMRTASARGAAPHSDAIATTSGWLVPVRVDSVCDTGLRGPVYDLSVAGQPEFIASGILVSNCWDSVRYGLDGEIKSKGSAGLYARIGAELAA